MEKEANIFKAVASKSKGIADGAKRVVGSDTVSKALLAIGALGGVATVKNAIIDPLVEQANINKAYNEIYKKYPNLASQDKSKVKDYFNVVKTYSPKAASNPLVAGSLVNKMVQFQGVDHKLVQDMSSLQKDVNKPTASDGLTMLNTVMNIANTASKLSGGAGTGAE